MNFEVAAIVVTQFAEETMKQLLMLTRDVARER